MSLPNPQAAQRIDAARADLAMKVTERHFRRRPHLEARFGAAGRKRCAEDAEFHMAYLVQAMALGVPELLSEYFVWAASVLQSRGIGVDDLREDMVELQALLAEEIPDAQASARAVLSPALDALSAPAREPAPMAGPARRYLDALLDDPVSASHVIDELVAAGMSVREIYVDVLQPAQHEIGRLWQANSISVADEHYSTAVTQRIIANLFSDVFQKRGRGETVVVACVLGELHELGARMVCDLLQLEGYDSRYLGASLPARSIVDFACAHEARVLALSASIVPHLAEVRQAIQSIRNEERCRDMKILVGGNAFNGAAQLWRLVGADAWAPDAATALAAVKTLLSRA